LINGDVYELGEIIDTIWADVALTEKIDHTDELIEF
jgi:hypothetical protein